MARVRDSSGNAANLEGISEGMRHPDTVSVGTSTTEIVPRRPSRNYLLIINDGTTTMYLGIGEDAVLNEGIRLNANGGSYQMTPDGGNMSHRAINGIVSTGTAVALITESG